MLNSIASIREQLDAGEDSVTEFKEIRLGKRSVISPKSEDLAEEMVAFANAEGGTLFLGVDDQGIVKGIPNDHLGIVENWIVNSASNHCDPPMVPAIRKMRLPNMQGESVTIMLVEVNKSIYVHRTISGRWLIRIGSSKRNLTQPELLRLSQQRGRSFVFDEQSIYNAAKKDLDFENIKSFFSETVTIPFEDLLLNTRITIRDENGIDRPTVAGLLTFSPTVQEYLPSTYIEAAIYRGIDLDSNDLIHSQQIKGTVSEQIDDALLFVERFMIRASIKPVGRIDQPQFSLSAVFEALVNAVTHRDYSIFGSKIRLFMFADRLELYSPGDLPNTVTLENMPFRVFTRNQLLVSFLSRMKSKKTNQSYLESRGEGVRRIIRESEALSGKKPEYRLLGQELLLIIWCHKAQRINESKNESA
ncbi:MAG: transcriptional regulator [Planctomycetes bacterium]|nr:transcriptional regulator [Planctomycetota bacterium]